MTILYPLDGGLYVNVTNRCPCSCVFCIRTHSDHILESDSLWFSKGEEPSAEQIIDEFKKTDLSQYNEIVFCGYGEPLSAMDTVLTVLRFLRDYTTLPIRINTNGLSDLLCKREHTALELNGLVDTLSISLNAPTTERFDEITKNIYPGKAFEAMLKFAKEAKTVVPKVVFTVVDVISDFEIEQCRKIADDMEIEFRVREYIDTYQ